MFFDNKRSQFTLKRAGKMDSEGVSSLQQQIVKRGRTVWRGVAVSTWSSGRASMCTVCWSLPPDWKCSVIHACAGLGPLRREVFLKPQLLEECVVWGAAVRRVLKMLSSEAMRGAVVLLLLSCVSWTLSISDLCSKAANASRFKFPLGAEISQHNF